MTFSCSYGFSFQRNLIHCRLGGRRSSKGGQPALVILSRAEDSAQPLAGPSQYDSLPLPLAGKTSGLDDLLKNGTGRRVQAVADEQPTRWHAEKHSFTQSGGSAAGDLDTHPGRDCCWETRWWFVHFCSSWVDFVCAVMTADVERWLGRWTPTLGRCWKRLRGTGYQVRTAKLGWSVRHKMG